MKSTVIFFNAITSFKSDLTPLAYPDTQNILFVNSHIFNQLNEKQKDFFDKIHIVDPITFDTALPLVKQYLQKIKNEDIHLVTNDEYCSPIVGQLIDELGLQGYGKDAFLKFIDKIVMKDTLNSQRIRTPYHQLFDKEKYNENKQQYIQEVENKFKYPFILKPVSLYGAKDVNKIHNETEWMKYAEKAAESQFDFQIEEYISGAAFHCDAIVKDSNILFNSISEYVWPILRFKQGYPTGSMYLSCSDSRWNKLNEFHQKVITALQPPDGATHCEMFLTDNNEVVFLEIAARPSGALVVSNIEKITGINLEQLHFKLRLHRPVTIEPLTPRIFSLFCYVPKIHGKVTSVKMPAIKSECHVEWNVKPGDVTESPDEDDIIFKPEYIAATIILNNPVFSELYDDFLILKNARFITTDNQISS